MTSEDTPFDRYALPPLEGVTDAPAPAPPPPVEHAAPPLPPPVPSNRHDWRDEMDFDAPELLETTPRPAHDDGAPVDATDDADYRDNVDDDLDEVGPAAEAEADPTLADEPDYAQHDIVEDEDEDEDENEDEDDDEAEPEPEPEPAAEPERERAYFEADFDAEPEPEPGPLARRSRLRSPLAGAARAVDVVDALRARAASPRSRAETTEADAAADAVVFATAAQTVAEDHDADRADRFVEPEPILPPPPPIPASARPAALAPVEEPELDDRHGDEDDEDELPDFLRSDAVEAAFGIRPGDDERMLLLEPESHLTATLPAEQPVRIKKDRPKPTVARTLAEIPVLLIVAALIAFLVKTFLAQAYYIPSGSMIPQLQIDDRVVVSKLAFKMHDPRRGDIVVFDDPRPGASSTTDDGTGLKKLVRKVGEGVGIVQPSTDEFIKRVIGLPGDQVSGHDGFVYINDHKLLEPYLPEGVETTDFPSQTVAPGRLWVMGDNRSGSADSRVFGQIKISTIVGRAVVKVWPFDHISFL
ncbi:MAG: signal peptidase [Actinomycetota bacterium]